VQAREGRVFADINWLATILAALSGFAVGGLWYGPIMGKRWQAAIGLSDETLRGANMPALFGATLVLSLVASIFLSHMFTRLGNPPLHIVMMISVGIAIGFVIPALWINLLFGRAKRALLWIDAGYWLLFYAAMGLVHGLFMSR